MSKNKRLSKRKFGVEVWVNGNHRNRYVKLCSCQQIIINRNKGHNWECNKCGNTYFVDARNKRGKRFAIPHFEVLRKDSRGFKIKRTNLTVEIDRNMLTVTPIKENMVRVLDYDMVDKRMILWKNGIYETCNKRRSIDMHEKIHRLFTEVYIDDFINLISTQTTRGLFESAKDMSPTGHTRKYYSVGLIELFNKQYLQILANAGIPNVRRFNNSWESQYINKDKTKPHEILGVPKFMMPYIREDESISMNTIRKFQKLAQVIDHNKLKQVVSIAKDEASLNSFANCGEELMQIHLDYEYTNLKKLILYIFREVRMHQGITRPYDACILLRDYIRMSREMGTEWERYSKSLKKDHDVTQMNYRVLDDEDKKEAFSLSVQKKSYQNLKFKDKEYGILIPKTIDDLVKEGSELSHCVASYASSIMKDMCKIVFLRDMKDKEKPLATIEVRGMNIRQARGFANRDLTKTQREFITKWAKSKNLVENYY